MERKALIDLFIHAYALGARLGRSLPPDHDVVEAAVQHAMDEFGADEAEARLAAQSPIVEWVAEIDYRPGEHDAMRDRARALLGRSEEVQHDG